MYIVTNPTIFLIVQTFQNTNLMHNSFILQLYIYFTLRSSTCFEQHAAHHQEERSVKYIYS